MHTSLAPMGSATVRFAKAYRAEEVPTAGARGAGWSMTRRARGRRWRLTAGSALRPGTRQPRVAADRTGRAPTSAGPA